MTKNQFLDRQYELSVMAGVNQKFHQGQIKHYADRDRYCKIAVGFLAVLGVCLCVVTATVDGWFWDAVSILIASLAAAAAVALNVLPFGEWASGHHALFQRWTDLREDVDDLLYRVVDEPTPDDLARLRELSAKCHRICGTETHCDDGILQVLQDKEEKSRRPAPTPCAS
jgi:hypothetical protein